MTCEFVVKEADAISYIKDTQHSPGGTENIWVDGIRAETRTECLWEISQLRQTTQLVSSKGSKHINTGCSDLSGTPFKTLAKAETLFLLY
jgi:hypothetical protein